MNMSNGLIAIIFGAISVVLSFVLVKKSRQLKDAEDYLETAKKETAKARTEASKATAQKEASSVSSSVSKSVALHITKLVADAVTSNTAIAELDNELEKAEQDNDINKAIEIAKRQAELAVSLGMTNATNQQKEEN